MPVDHPLYPDAPHLQQLARKGMTKAMTDFLGESRLRVNLLEVLLEAEIQQTNAWATIRATTLLHMLDDLHSCRETIVRMHEAAAGAQTEGATVGHIEDIQNYRERSEEVRLVAMTLLRAVDAQLNGTPHTVDLQWARKVLSLERYDPEATASTAFTLAKKGNQ